MAALRWWPLALLTLACLVAVPAGATDAPTAVPTQAPTTVAPTVTLEPTTERYRLSHISWQDIGVLASIEAWLMLALVGMFELLRHLKNLYSPRQTRKAAATDLHSSKMGKVPKRPQGLLRWVKPVLQVRGKEVADLVGLDAYMLLRVIKLCIRISLFASVVGCIVLLPVYASGDAGNSGFNRLTLNNLDADSQLSTFWIPAFVNFFCTLHIFYLLDNEYHRYTQWHLQFMSSNDSEAQHQAACTVLVEGIPIELRSNVALAGYLDIIFPGKVHAARVQVSVKELEMLHAERMRVVDKLERADRLAKLTGQKGSLVLHNSCMSRLRCEAGTSVDPVEHYSTQLAELNKTIDDMQRTILAERKEEETQAKLRLEGVMAVVRESFHNKRTDDAAQAAAMPSTPQAVAEEAVEGGAAMPPQYNPMQRHGSGLGSLNAEDEAGTRMLPTAMDFVKNAMLSTADDTISVTKTVVTNFTDEVASGVTAQINLGRRAADALVDTVTTVALGKRMSNVAFVTMTSEFWATMLAHGPDLTLRQIPGANPFGLTMLNTGPAPDYRDIIWPNVTLTRNTVILRRTATTAGWVLFAVLWSSVIVVVTALGTSSAVLHYVELNDSGRTVALIHEYLPSILQLGLLALIPVLVQFVAVQYEGYKSQTEVQAVILSRYFMFQIANIFLTVSAGSFASYIRTILNHPNDLATKLAEAFPTVGAYFIEFIVIKLLFGLSWELSRFWPATQYLLAHFFTDKRKWTERSLRNAFSTYPSLLYGWVYPSILGVIVVTFLYSVITPMVSVFALAFFIVAELVFKNQVLYVYISKSESGGLLWHLVFDRIMGGLVFSHMVLFAYIYLIATSWGLPFFVACIIIADFVFWSRCHAAYTRHSASIPLELAAEKDRQRVMQRRNSGRDEVLFDIDQYEQPALVPGAVEPIPFDPTLSVHEIATTEVDDELHNLEIESATGRSESKNADRPDVKFAS